MKEAFKSQVWGFSLAQKEGLQKATLFLKEFCNWIYKDIHSSDNEEEIREEVRYSIATLLKWCKSRVTMLNLKRQNGMLQDKELRIMFDLLECQDLLMAIASFRSLTHFAMYMETQDSENDKVWKYTMDSTMGGIFWYVNKAILDHEYDNIIKQCPTGYGKCFSENMRVLTSRGYLQAKNIEVGDLVYSMKDNKPVVRKVLNKWNSEKSQVKIKVRNGIEIIVSPEHKLYTQRGYLQAMDLTTNDYLYCLVKKSDFVWNQIISIERCEDKIRMVDLEIEETHNFILEGIVSHNSKSDCDIIAFALGVNPSTTIMKVVGNPTVLKTIFERVVAMLKTPKYSKVFPIYSKYENKDDMFKNCSSKDGSFLLADSKSGTSFAVFNKKTPIDGTRYDIQLYDDITQSADQENITAHEVDDEYYNRQWKRRSSTETEVLRIFTGTSYHREDFISKRINEFAKKLPYMADLKTANFKWNRFVKISQDQRTIVYQVPKLVDLSLGEDKCYSSFPQKYPKEKALYELHNASGSKKRTFYAMEQQTPLPPDSMAFDYAYLQQYTTLPDKEEKEQVIAIIDTAKMGKDNFACLIFNKYKDNKLYYLVDCYYEKVSSKIAVPAIGEKISRHFCSTIFYEANATDVDLFESELSKSILVYGWNGFEINCYWSEMNKELKIAKYRDDIKDLICFPSPRITSPESPLGRAMYEIVNYSFEGKNKHDDAIDCCASLMKLASENIENESTVLDI